MKRLIVLIAVLAGIAGSSVIKAQRDSRVFEENVVTVVVNDDIDPAEVENILKKNAAASPKDNGLPRFAIVGKDRKFYLGIGAQFLGEGVFDWRGAMPSPLLMVPADITKPTAGNGASLGFGWQSSSIYMNFVAMPGSGDQIGLFFKANFMGDDNAFNCYHLYARYRRLTVGYTNSLFTDGAAEPFTIDFQGPNGYPDLTLFTAYWEQKLDSHFSIAAGIDAPTAELPHGSSVSPVNQRLPAIPVYFQYAWNSGKSHVRLSGLLRPMQYRNMSEATPSQSDRGYNQTVTGAGIQLSGMTGIAGSLSLQFNGVYGSGIASYIQDDNGLDIDALASDKAGKMELTRTIGLTGGLTYVFSPKVSSNLVYSHVRNHFSDDANIRMSDQYRSGDYLAANIIYAVNKFVSFGIEYDHARRVNTNDIKLSSNRIQCQFAVTF